MAVQNGGVVNTNGIEIGGIARTSPGTVTVSNAGSQLNGGFITVGVAGQGTLTIQNGGVVTTPALGISGADVSAPGIVTVSLSLIHI